MKANNIINATMLLAELDIMISRKNWIFSLFGSVSKYGCGNDIDILAVNLYNGDASSSYVLLAFQDLGFKVIKTHKGLFGESYVLEGSLASRQVINPKEDFVMIIDLHIRNEEITKR